MEKPKYSLHLFAGGGGGILADIIDGIRPVCAVEIEDYQQRILAARFPDMPIWDDVRTFRADNPECAGAIEDLRGHAHELVISGGFPCQDISSAGKGAGIGGARSGLWKEYARIIREIRPRFVFVENSPLLVSRGLGIVLADLAAMGYHGAWGVLSASAVGARHRRDRFWGLFRGGGYRMYGTVTTQTSIRSPRFRRNSAPNPGELVAEELARMYPTPTVCGNNNNITGAGMGLGTFIKVIEGVECRQTVWPTPCATDYKGPGSSGTPRDRLDYAIERGQTKSNTYPTPRALSLCGGTGAFEKIQANENLTEGDKKALSSTGGRLNPDWVEWLMGWPVGWTDIELDNGAPFPWLGLSDDPADAAEPSIRRITTRQQHRAHRIETLGNGQVPLCAAVAFNFAFEILRVALGTFKRKENA